jgi:ribonucleoside-diphosphate reductase beta chain
LAEEFNTTPDIQDFKINLTEQEREVVTRAMLSISQVEVNVKRFWGNLYSYFPKPEIESVGATFAESEVRHMDAYSTLLEKLGLNSEFEKIYEIPAIIDRTKYLEKIMGKYSNREDIMLQIILFSLLVEHISLFGQFYIIMSFNKRKNIFKGLSNIVEATSKEEDIHGRFGIEIFNIVTKENPDLNNDAFRKKVSVLSKKAFEAEVKILDWIFEQGDLPHLTKSEVLNFVSNRFNKSLAYIGAKDLFPINVEELEKTNWFDEELTSTKENDFFNKRSIDYSKKQKQITEDDLF